jgi:hypothetical protein
MKINVAIVVVFFVGASGLSNAQEYPDEWQFALTPYLWLPVIDGTISHAVPPGGGGNPPNVSVGPTDWLDLLNIGALITGNARKGRLSIFSDLVYLSLTSKNDGRILSVEDNISVPGTPIQIPVSASLNLNTRTDLDGLQWMVAGGYSLAMTESSSMDVFAGVRYFGVDVTTSWDLSADITTPGGTVVLPAQGSVASDTDLWDGIVGLRGHFQVADSKWAVPYYLDIGAGDSDLTWNGLLGFSREFGWGDLIIAYRHLDYDQDPGELLHGFSFSGPAIGARFRF